MTSPKNEQSQKVSQNSLAVQASGDVTITSGITYSEARQIAMDVIAAEFQRLAGAAKETAQARVDEIRGEFFEKLKAEYPRGIDQAADVDFQHGMYVVQRDYARTGDKDLGDLLVDLLVDRSKETERNMKQIVLNESLATAAKLTRAQVAALGLIFLFRYTRNSTVTNIDTMGEYLDKFAKPLVDGFEIRDSSFQHLAFTGCGSLSMGSVSLSKVFTINYKGIFTDGFEKSALEGHELETELRRYVCPAIRDANRFQVAFVSDDALDGAIKERGASDRLSTELKRLFNLGVFDEAKLRSSVLELRPYMGALFDAWEKTRMKSFELTSVGIAIGHASIKRYAGEFADLSSWVG
jgi:hypothetical protein